MDRNDVAKFLHQNWLQLSLIGVGFILLGGGIAVAMSQTNGSEMIVISASPLPSPSAVLKTIKVDIQGAVEKPGVYTLIQGDRVADGLIAAGGMSAKADRSYIARFINQAAIMQDGLKIYIPAEGETLQNSTNPTSNSKQITITPNQISNENNSGLISINNASLAELDNLWGIGSARAQTIIDNRPYSSLQELVTKAKISQSILDHNKDKLGL